MIHITQYFSAICNVRDCVANLGGYPHNRQFILQQDLLVACREAGWYVDLFTNICICPAHADQEAEAKKATK